MEGDRILPRREMNEESLSSICATMERAESAESVLYDPAESMLRIVGRRDEGETAEGALREHPRWSRADDEAIRRFYSPYFLNRMAGRGGFG